MPHVTLSLRQLTMAFEYRLADMDISNARDGCATVVSTDVTHILQCIAIALKAL
jgi:hypothetical protein